VQKSCVEPHQNLLHQISYEVQRHNKGQRKEGTFFVFLFSQENKREGAGRKEIPHLNAYFNDDDKNNNRSNHNGGVKQKRDDDKSESKQSSSSFKFGLKPCDLRELVERTETRQQLSEHGCPRLQDHSHVTARGVVVATEVPRLDVFSDASSLQQLRAHHGLARACPADQPEHTLRTVLRVRIRVPPDSSFFCSSICSFFSSHPLAHFLEQPISAALEVLPLLWEERKRR